jgi:integrase
VVAPRGHTAVTTPAVSAGVSAHPLAAVAAAAQDQLIRDARVGVDHVLVAVRAQGHGDHLQLGGFARDVHRTRGQRGIWPAAPCGCASPVHRPVAVRRRLGAVVRDGHRVTVPTLAAWLEEWSASRRHHLEASSVRSYRDMADAYLLPHLGDVLLDHLDVRTIEATYTVLLSGGGRGGRPLAPRTVAYVHAILHRCLVDAVRLEVIAANPAARATVPRRATDGRAPRRLQVWDADQVRRFLRLSAGQPLAELWAVALGTGMRRGELLGLRCRDVDLTTGRLTVATSLVHVDGTPRWKPPKTGRTRTLSLDPTTTEALRRAVAGRRGDVPVFADAAGGPLLPQPVSDRWRRYVRTLDLPPIRLHDLRHTHATLLLAAGVPVKVVSERLGHTKVAMTLDVYAHVLPAMDRDAADRFGQLLADADAGTVGAPDRRPEPGQTCPDAVHRLEP